MLHPPTASIRCPHSEPSSPQAMTCGHVVGVHKPSTSTLKKILNWVEERWIWWQKQNYHPWMDVKLTAYTHLPASAKTMVDYMINNGGSNFSRQSGVSCIPTSASPSTSPSASTSPSTSSPSTMPAALSLSPQKTFSSSLLFHVWLYHYTQQGKYILLRLK